MRGFGQNDAMDDTLMMRSPFPMYGNTICVTAVSPLMFSSTIAV